ncbi:MAG TPA: hypothetical protein VJN95_10170 [Gemmatimonadales bacterium]|nr:hypothetical protein [Gemmatimonadales bacterium]
MKAPSILLGISVAAMSLSAGVEGIKRFGLSLAGQSLAAAPSPILTVLGSGAVLVLGCWLCVVLLRHHKANLGLILAWSGAAAVLAILFHLNHVAYAEHCRPSGAPAPLTHRCLELQRRGRIAATAGWRGAAL